MIPSSDQDRSIAFYEALGFETRSDFLWGGSHRWVEVYPPRQPDGWASDPNVTSDGPHPRFDCGCVTRERDGHQAKHARDVLRGVRVA
jgi:catechol 2,3-dioxygenase-like lactoylglutathione lyase family enzyme